ncbi:DUF898 domain-containing protein [Shewanella submarina]|uniref:YjgN family protein n=1 Tax=Shewanella submarina TaxID=2016376 RepID=A0ABV7GC85_9GAMM|nr:YjgN family protein [Shewanella submarina]MCL1036742.1 DUF898 domain-containing protein [Shewanella submarina]
MEDVKQLNIKQEIPGESDQSPGRTVPVNFSGQAGEFFGIWIVNILLSIVTLGIYSAWAKVRTHQYFYSNTEIDGHRFNYLATPMQILKGRILALILFIAYYVLTSYFPVAGAIAIVVMLFLSPWLINQGMRFHLRMTQYRNVRFSFEGSYGGALAHFILLPIMGVFTLYLAFPWVLKKIDEYLYSNIRYGDLPLQTKLSSSQYYLAALIVFVVSGMFGVVAMTVLTASMGIAAMDPEATAAADPSPFAMVAVFAVYIVMIGLVTGIYESYIRNHIFANSKFDDVAEFESELSPFGYGMLHVTNALAIVFSLGLAYPWTKVRKSKYLADATKVTVLPGAEQVVDDKQDGNSAFGEEASQLFDMDIALT